MAKEVGLNQTAVHRIWKAFGLQPHRTETFKLSGAPASNAPNFAYSATAPVPKDASATSNARTACAVADAKAIRALDRVGDPCLRLDSLSIRTA
jgi:hypothetical protein